MCGEGSGVQDLCYPHPTQLAFPFGAEWCVWQLEDGSGEYHLLTADFARSGQASPQYLVYWSIFRKAWVATHRAAGFNLDIYGGNSPREDLSLHANPQEAEHACEQDVLKRYG